MNDQQKNLFDSSFQLWKEHESIAMHFNELIIQLRMRALGGIAIIVTIAGAAARADGTEQYRWGLLAYTLLAACIVWIAVALLDLLYYNKLLKAAIDELLAIEKNFAKEPKKYGMEKVGPINLSTSIEKLLGYNSDEESTQETSPSKKKQSFKDWLVNKLPDMRKVFYVIIFVLLSSSCSISIYKAQSLGGPTLASGKKCKTPTQEKNDKKLQTLIRYLEYLERFQ